MAEPTPFVMPTLGADMDTGIVAKWHVAPGARVKRGDVILDVETHKGIIEVEVFTTGTVSRLLVPEGTQVPVGTVLAELAAEGAAADGPPAPEAPLAASASPRESAAPDAASPSPPESAAPHAATPWIRASPSARHLARETSIDLVTLQGTGHHSAIVRADVQRAIADRGARSAMTAPPPCTSGEEGLPLPTVAPPLSPALSPMRQAIAAAMAKRRRSTT